MTTKICVTADGQYQDLARQGVSREQLNTTPSSLPIELEQKVLSM